MDEEDLENQWKARLLKKEVDLKEEFNEERDSYKYVLKPRSNQSLPRRQISKLKDEYELEIDRLKASQARQLEAIQTTADQST